MAILTHLTLRLHLRMAQWQWPPADTEQCLPVGFTSGFQWCAAMCTLLFTRDRCRLCFTDLSSVHNDTPVLAPAAGMGDRT